MAVCTTMQTQNNSMQMSKAGGILLEFAPAVAEGQYDWSRKQVSLPPFFRVHGFGLGGNQRKFARLLGKFQEIWVPLVVASEYV